MSKFIADENDEGQRVDLFVSNKLPSISRSSVQKLIKSNRVKVNDTPVKSNHKIHCSDKVFIDYNQTLIKIPKISLPIIYEDESCVVINKPSGVLTHSKGAFNPEATVATFISSRLNKDDLMGDRAGIVHRLDRATSGVILCAKDSKALAWFQKQFSLRKVKKHYLAIIEETINPESAVIKMPIERNPKKPQTFRIGRNGKPAITTYHTQRTTAGYSLLDLIPKTGRTHQLRVHMKHLSKPIVGDTLYSGKLNERLLLHASSLEITLPTGERRIFKAPPPEDFYKLLKED